MLLKLATQKEKKTLLNQSHAKNATTKHKNCAATDYTKNQHYNQSHEK